MFVIHIRGKGLISLQKNLQKLIKGSQTTQHEADNRMNRQFRKERKGRKGVLTCLNTHKESSLLVAGPVSMG